jgi:hypothetical protein
MVTHGFRNETNVPAKNHNCNASRHSGARPQAASPESTTTAQGIWIPDLPLRGNPE